MLCGMTNPADFLATAFQTIRDFLRETSQLDMPVRALARQIRARLIMARSLLRRVLFLMTLALPVPDVDTPAADGVERKSGRKLAEKTEQPGPAQLALSSGRVWLRDKALPSLEAPRLPADIDTRLDRMMAQLVLMFRLAADPAAYAERLARRLAHQRAAGEAAPLCLPLAEAFRMPPEISLVAGAVQDRLSHALLGWHSSG
jgi:hypothetical protein